MQSSLSFLKSATDLLIGPSSNYCITFANKNCRIRYNIDAYYVAPIKFFNRTVMWFFGTAGLNLALAVLAKTSIGVAIGIPAVATVILTVPSAVIIILAMSLLSTYIIEKYGSRFHFIIFDRGSFKLTNEGL